MADWLEMIFALKAAIYGSALKKPQQNRHTFLVADVSEQCITSCNGSVQVEKSDGVSQFHFFELKLGYAFYD